MRDLNELAQEIHDNAVAHGWWDKESHEVEVNGCGIGVSTEPSDRNPFEVLALIHSEVSEVLEDLRKGFDPADLHFEVKGEQGLSRKYVPGAKPCGVPSEMADIIIRVLDACAAWGIDIEQAMALKMDYNINRPYRHGDKRA